MAVYIIDLVLIDQQSVGKKERKKEKKEKIFIWRVHITK
jgi:hypothetical protein